MRTKPKDRVALASELTPLLLKNNEVMEELYGYTIEYLMPYIGNDKKVYFNVRNKKIYPCESIAQEAIDQMKKSGCYNECMFQIIPIHFNPKTR